MDTVVEAIANTVSFVFHFLQTHNPILVICSLMFSLGIFFLVLSFFRTLWSAHVTIRLGPIALVVMAVVIAWLELPDGTREMLGEWIKMTPSELYAMMNGNSTSKL